MAQVPDFAGPFTGWRIWSIEDGYLHSVWGHRTMPWRPSEPAVAECAHEHRPADLACSCGLYALATPAGVVESLRTYLNYPGARDFLVGRVALWGKVVEGTRGFRAEFAYPTWLYVPFELWAQADALKRYGVPVEIRNPFTIGEKP